VPQLLQDLLALGSEGIQGIWLLLAGTHERLIVEGRSFFGVDGDKTEERTHFLSDVVGVSAKMPFSEPVEVAVEFWREFGEVVFLLDDNYLKETTVDLFLDILAGQENHIVRNQGNLLAPFAFKV